jgi:hypothetical protein
MALGVRQVTDKIFYSRIDYFAFSAAFALWAAYGQLATLWYIVRAAANPKAGEKVVLTAIIEWFFLLVIVVAGLVLLVFAFNSIRATFKAAKTQKPSPPPPPPPAQQDQLQQRQLVVDMLAGIEPLVRRTQPTLRDPVEPTIPAPSATTSWSLL